MKIMKTNLERILEKYARIETLEYPDSGYHDVYLDYADYRDWVDYRDIYIDYPRQ